MRRHFGLTFVVACTGVLAAIPIASAQAAACGPLWGIAPSWTRDSAFLLSASADPAGDAMAAGFRSISSTSERPIVEQWNGTQWLPVTTPAQGDDSLFSGITRSSLSSAVAVGWWAPAGTDPSRAFAEVWNGTSWTISNPITLMSGSTFLPTLLEGAASTDPSNVWAAGVSVNAANVEVPLIEHFSGTTWSVSNNAPVGDGGELVNVATDATNDAWAVGLEITGGGSGQVPLVMHWNGSVWQQVGTPNPGTFSGLTGVEASSATNAWAVGTSFNGSISAPIAMHWDGTQWLTVAVPNPAVNGATLQSVSAVGPNDVWAFGLQYTDPMGDSVPLIEHWDGTTWSVAQSAPGTPPPGDSGSLFGSTVASSHVLTVGYTQPNGGTGAASTSAEQLCPVEVQDAGYAPATAREPFGTTVYWSTPSTDGSSHSITDGSGTALFDSGLIAPGGSFSYQFTAAGDYTVTDTASGHVSHMDVSMSGTPATGTTATAFNIQWASAPPPAGYVDDVQIKRPGSSTFSDWTTGTTATNQNFTPDAGAGTYVFHARVRRLSPSAHTAYSPQLAITVS